MMPVQGFTAAVRQQLRRSGWAPLRTASSEQQVLLSDYLAAVPGAAVTAPRIEFELTLEAPSRLMLMMRIGEPFIDVISRRSLP